MPGLDTGFYFSEIKIQECQYVYGFECRISPHTIPLAVGTALERRETSGFEEHTRLWLTLLSSAGTVNLPLCKMGVFCTSLLVCEAERQAEATPTAGTCGFLL
jgi:hypothetical protein